MKILNVQTFTRREFLKDLKLKASLGVLSSAGLMCLAQCSGTAPESDDLNPPFICSGTCNTGNASPSDTTANITTTGYLIFSGYNNESGFSGYNIYYNTTAATIVSEHASGIKSSVIDQTGSLTVDSNNKGSSYPTIPSSLASGVLNASTYVYVQISNAVIGDTLYVTAYNTTDNVESVLSNSYTIV